MDTHIVKQQQMLDPTSRMPFSDTDKSVSSNGILPFANSENIAPPVNKEKIRVVDQATRTEVAIDMLKKWQEKSDRINDILEDLRLQAFFKKQQIQQGAVIDIEV